MIARAAALAGLAALLVACSQRGTEPEPEAVAESSAAPAEASRAPGGLVPDGSVPDAAEEAAAAWKQLLGSAPLDETEAACAAWLASENPSILAEARKCLANVTLARCRGRTAPAGAALAEECAREAARHLAAGIRAKPRDLSLHLGRMRVLADSRRFDLMSSALRDSLRLRGDPADVEEWLAYASELRRAGEAESAMGLLSVLAEHHPNDAEVVSRTGTALALSGRDEEAKRWLQRAVELRPGDDVARWNLATVHARLSEPLLADAAFEEAIAATEDLELRRERSCRHAAFVEESLDEPSRACALQRLHCPRERWTACR